jgi:hypothetical protein
LAAQELAEYISKVTNSAPASLALRTLDLKIPGGQLQRKWVVNFGDHGQLRQWVLSIPFELRIVLAKRSDVLNACGRIFVQEIFRWQRQVALLRGYKQVKGAAINFLQRFGGSLNLNVHFHVLVPDAFFFVDEEGEVQRELLPKPSAFDLSEITHNLTCRFLKWMKKRGYLAADNQVGVDAYDSSTPSPIDAFLGGSLGMGLLAEFKQGGREPSTVIEHQSVTASKRVRAGVQRARRDFCNDQRRARAIDPLLRSATLEPTQPILT